MSVEDKVTAMVKDWANRNWAGPHDGPPAGENLELIWMAHGNGIDFYKPAAQELTRLTLQTFPGRPGLDTDVQTGFFYDSQHNTGGTIKTPDDLTKEILAHPLIVKAALRRKQ